LGLKGGKAGHRRELRINGKPVHPKGRYLLQPGDAITALEAGGGGFGPPAARDPRRIESDIENGYVSAERAQADYGFGEKKARSA
jgi:N-methylhydantoinase B